MRTNMFGTQGYCTDEQRKQSLDHRCNHLDFKSCIDLSVGVKITCFYSDKVSLTNYTKDIASFMTWWTLNVLPMLNGFSGVDTIKFEIEGFNIIS